MDRPPCILLCGPDRAAVSGVATHLNQLFGSSLNATYALHQYQVGSEGRVESGVRKLLRFITSPFVFVIVILRLRPDIVHLNTSMEVKSYWRDLAYLFAARLLGRRVIYQVHGGELPSHFLGSNRVAQAFVRFTLGVPDVIVLLAEVERAAYREFGAGRRIEVIPNAIRLDEYADGHAKRFEGEGIVLGYIGRLADDKGVEEAIEAVAALRRQGVRSVGLRIAGSGPYERKLRDIALAKSPEVPVEFLGPVFGEEKLRFWREIDIFVFPTFHREGLPYTILESMASATPVITTRVGGIPDVIQEGVQGLLLDTHDAEAVAAAITRMISDRQRLREMSAAAIQRAKEYYGVERLADQFDRLYRELLA